MPERYRLFVSALALLFFSSICPAQAIGWLNCAWPYRSTVTIFNPVGTTVSAYKKDVVLSGSKFDFTEAQANAFAPAASYAVKAAISRTSHSSWINESPVISASDAIYLARTRGLMARGNTISWVTNFPLREDTVASLTLNPSRVMGGTSSQGTVTLRRTAGPGGIAVALTSSNTAAAQVPTSVTVAANATSATFTITTTAVSSATSATISASYNGSTQTASLAVTQPLPTVASLALNPSSVVGGTSSQGTVTLSGAAPAGGIAVALTSSNPAAAQVAASVTVAANVTSATFTITTTAVSSATSSTISASYNGSTQTASLVVTRPIPTVASLALNPSSVVGGSNSQGPVTLTGPAPSGGAAVTLTSSNPAAAQVAASVTVAANATSATFTISTTAVSSATSSTISATYNTTQTAVLGVGPSTLGWLDPAWLYRSAVTISNPGGTTLSAYQVHVVLSGSNFDFTKPQSSGADIRFTASDGVSLLPYWIGKWNAGTSSASLLVQVP